MGPPAEGEPVQVRWTDGLLYGAKFLSAHSDPMFMVRSSSFSQYLHLNPLNLQLCLSLMFVSLLD